MTAPALQPGRWWRYVRHRRICCPAGHHIPNSFNVTEAGFIRCQQHRCDRWVFAYAVRGGGVIVAEVTLDEQAEMAELQTPAAMFDYLQIWNGAT